MERPIIFNGEMVRAILEGRKTQTRRVIKGKILEMLLNGDRENMTFEDQYGDSRSILELCPYGQPGDRLWVRETWQENLYLDSKLVLYKADKQKTDFKWRPSIHMPRWASRLTLKIISIRVERLQEISDKDALAEGVRGPECYVRNGFLGDQEVNRFGWLWDSINTKTYPWSSNPWVWIIEFNHSEVG